MKKEFFKWNGSFAIIGAAIIIILLLFNTNIVGLIISPDISSSHNTPDPCYELIGSRDTQEIIDNQNITDDIKLEKHILVSGNGQLTIKGSTMTIFQSHDYEYNITIRDQGKLILESSKITSGKKLAIKILDEGELHLLPGSEFSPDIADFSGESSLVMDGCLFKPANMELNCKSVKLENLPDPEPLYINKCSTFRSSNIQGLDLDLGECDEVLISSSKFNSLSLDKGSYFEVLLSSEIKDSLISSEVILISNSITDSTQLKGFRSLKYIDSKIRDGFSYTPNSASASIYFTNTTFENEPQFHTASEIHLFNVSLGKMNVLGDTVVSKYWSMEVRVLDKDGKGVNGAIVKVVEALNPSDMRYTATCDDGGWVFLWILSNQTTREKVPMTNENYKIAAYDGEMSTNYDDNQFSADKNIEIVLGLEKTSGAGGSGGSSFPWFVVLMVILGLIVVGFVVFLVFARNPNLRWWE